MPHKLPKKRLKKLKKITNEIFLIIQNDRELMHEYLRAVEKDTLDVVNQQIGKSVKIAYSLINANEREDNPSCTLIQSHQVFRRFPEMIIPGGFWVPPFAKGGGTSIQVQSLPEIALNKLSAQQGDANRLHSDRFSAASRLQTGA